MSGGIRLDKWLWAARFFKTRSLAKQAIEGGKVHCEGARVKVSKEIHIGSVLTIRQGWDEKTVEVLELSDKRGGAPDAARLYKETAESTASREAAAADRRAQRDSVTDPTKRPDKRNRRRIRQFRDQNAER